MSTSEAIPGILGWVWALMIWAMMVATGAICVQYFDDYHETTAEKSSVIQNVQEMGRDWNKSPYVDIEYV